MAEEGRRTALEVLRSTEATPIAQLHPDIDDVKSRVIDGVITITWPYSVVTKSIAFILAEHDFRLRREGGQLRIEFHGAAGRALADSGIGGGDEIRLVLDGAQWDNNQAPTRLPAGILDWQLKFTNRLLLHVRRADAQEPEVIDVDAEEADEEPRPAADDTSVDRLSPPPLESQPDPDHATPIAMPAASSLSAKRQASSAFGMEEYASPAFLKRARVSYGSLFEGGLDIFDEEKEKDKNRRRSRFSMSNTVWQYSSRSPTPEANDTTGQESDLSDESTENAKAQAAPDTLKPSPPRLAMVDEGCQTLELYLSPSLDVQASAETRLAAPPVQPTPTPAPVAARYEGNHSGFQSPSRTLFGPAPSQYGVARSAGEPDMAYQASSPHNHDLVFGADPHGDISTTAFSVPPAAISTASTVTFDESIAGPHYPIATFGADNLSAAVSNIDPSLQFSGGIPAPNHEYYDAPQPEHMTWRAESLSTGYPPLPVQHDAQHHLVVVDSSPAREQLPSVELEATSSVDSAGNVRLSASRDERASPNRVPREAEEAETISRDDAEEEYRDGGDIAGEDYDLRNYDRAKYDDDEAQSDEESPPDNSDVEQQAINFNEDDESEEGVRDGEEDDEAGYDGEFSENVENNLAAKEGIGYASNGEPDLDDKAEYYHGRQDCQAGEEYEGEDYDEDEEEYEDDEEEADYDDDDDGPGPAPRVSAPQEPVFISLLSDSEDEAETQPNTTASGRASTQPESPRQLYGTDGEVSAEPATDAETQKGASLEAGADDENPKQDVRDDVDRGLAIEAHPAPPQTPHLTAPEAAGNSREGTGQDASQPDASSPDRSQQLDGGQLYESPPNRSPQDTTRPDGSHLEAIQHAEVGERGEDAVDEVEASIATGAIDARKSDATEVDQVSNNGGHTTSSVDREVQPQANHAETLTQDETVDKEGHATSFVDGDVQPRTDRAEALIQDEPVDEPAEAVMGREDVDMEDSESQPPGLPRVEERGQDSTGASDVMMQDPSQDRSAEDPDYHLEHHTPDTVMSSAMTEVQEARVACSVPDSHREEASNVAHLRETVDRTAFEEGIQQVPTRSEAQPNEDVSAAPGAEKHPVPENEDDLAAEAQIITEYQEHQAPTMQTAAGTAHTDSSEMRDEDQPRDNGKRLEVLITVKSSRGRTHRKNGSGDASSESHEDPSILLAKAPTPEQEKETKWPTVLRVSRNKGDQADPSIPLARGKTTRPVNDESPSSSRLTRSMTEQADAKAQSAKASFSSTRSTRRQATPETTRELRSKPHDNARSGTPEVVAEFVLKSPSLADSVPEDEDVAALKRELNKTLRTRLAHFLSLRLLRTFLNKTVDILAVSTWTPSQPHRPKNGPRDYMLELILADFSTAPSSVSVAHIFRPHQASLPVVHAGDVVLLRRMQVVSMKGRGFGVRTGDGSGWAVFEKGDEDMLPQVKGPPVEVTDQEVEYAQGLRRWWAMQNEKTLAKVERATQKALQAGKNDSK